MNVQTPREGFVADDADTPVDRIAASAPDPVDLIELPKQEWPVKVRLLHRPVRNNKNEMVHELSFREPTAGDVNRYGNPVWINLEGIAMVDDRKMLPMLAALSGVLQPFLEAMDPRDYNSCAYRMRVFFVPDISAW